jgi:hypothetical protein
MLLGSYGKWMELFGRGQHMGDGATVELMKQALK